MEVEGKELSYQWLYCPPGASDFEYLPEETSNVLKVPMTEESDGASYRCFITDFTGNMGSTRIATVKLDTRDWEMSYDSSGVRTQRTSADKTYNYTYAGDKLVKMTVGEDVLEFSYDVDGKPLTMSLNGTVYYYITNLQSDVISVENSNLTIASYAYDAWGNILGMTGTYAELNPLRYRGYVYDQETGFYYLNSRYYDPAVGRFLNADNYTSIDQGILGYNMYAYCKNKVVIYRDSAGNTPETIIDLITLGVSVAEVVANPSDPMAWIGLVGDAFDLIPIVTGVGELVKGLRIVDKAGDMVEIADSVGDSIDTYRNVRKVTKGTGLEAHHILEKRFVRPLELGHKSTSDMFSVPLTKAAHREITNQWRESPLAYGSTYSLGNVVARGIAIYKNDPRLMRAFIQSFVGK